MIQVPDTTPAEHPVRPALAPGLPVVPETAQAIVNALRAGTVPPEGLEHYAVGLSDPIQALREQRAFVARGRGAYKFVRGPYGAGKTFLTSLAACEALQEGFVVSKVVVSVADTPLYRLSEIYRRMCQGLTVPGRRGGALQSIVDRWLFSLEQQVIEVDGKSEDDDDFAAAVAGKVEQSLAPVGQHAGRLAACLKAYHDAQFHQDYVEARGILDWLSGESKVGAGVKRAAGVSGQIDNSDALVFLRGLLELMRMAGHAGLLLVLDEVEIVLRMRRPERMKSLEVLRQLIDAVDQNEFPGLHLLVTGTPDFFDSAHGVAGLEPLHERIRVDFRDDRPDNLRQPQIRLSPFDRERLLLVAERVRELYPAQDAARLQSRVSAAFASKMADAVTGGFGGHVDVVPRLFLREFVNVLDLVDQRPDYDPQASWQFDPANSRQLELRPEEEVALMGAVREVVF